MSYTKIGTSRKEISCLFLLIALAIMLSYPAYPIVLNAYHPYDDEGYLLISLKFFNQGLPLYSEVFSQYGPFFYQFFDTLFSIFGISFSHDNARYITIAIWLASSTMLGITAFNLTRKILLGAICQLVSFGALAVLAWGPMHPVGLIALLLSALTMIISFLRNGSSKWLMVCSGVAVGLLLMVKINIGIFAIAAFLFAYSMTIASIHQVFRWLVMVLFIAMPFVLMASQLKFVPVDVYALHVFKQRVLNNCCLFSAQQIKNYIRSKLVRFVCDDGRACVMRPCFNENARSRFDLRSCPFPAPSPK